MATPEERNRGLGAYSTPGVDVLQPGAKEFEGAKASPVVGFAFRGLQPPSNLYVNESDNIQVLSRSSSAITVLIRTRILRADGTVIVGSEPLVVPGDRSAATRGIGLTEGFLLGVQISNLVGAFERGTCYVMAWFGRGSASAGFSTSPLVAGYILPNTFLGWPGVNPQSALDGQGNIRSIQGTTPAAGAEVTEVVPTNARWRLQSFRVAFTTSAAVASRDVSFTLDDGVAVDQMFSADAQTAQAAGDTQSYSFSPTGQFATGVFKDNLTPSPAGLILMPGWRIRTVTQNLQAGDQYGQPKYTVEEWIDN